MLDISNNIVHSDLFLKPITFERNIGLSYRNPPLPTINRETRWFKETASSEGRTPHRQQTHPWERRQTISAPRSRQRRTTRSSFRCSPFDRGYRSRSWSKSSGRRRSCTPPSRPCCSSGVVCGPARDQENARRLRWRSWWKNEVARCKIGRRWRLRERGCQCGLHGPQV